MSETKWQEKQFDSLGYHKTKVKRTLFLDKYPDPQYKYKEKIDFLEVDKPYAICIGFNPAKADEDLDDTNKRLIKTLKTKYGGYYLFNLYPKIEANQVALQTTDTSFIEYICKKIESEDFINLDVVLFFGRTATIPDAFVEYLEKDSFAEHRKVFITVHGDEFTHPSANASIELQEFRKEYLQKEIVIRIKKRERAWQK